MAHPQEVGRAAPTLQDDVTAMNSSGMMESPEGRVSQTWAPIEIVSRDQASGEASRAPRYHWGFSRICAKVTFRKKQEWQGGG